MSPELTNPVPEPCPPLLHGLAHELALMIPVVEGLSGLVMDHAVQADATERPRILAQAQAVDDLTQRLQAVLELTQAVAEGVAVDRALADVRLADMAVRLKRALAGDLTTPAPSDGPGGELMLFDQP